LRRFAQERLKGDRQPAISAPNVFMLHHRFVSADRAEIRAQAEIDIVFNDVVAPEKLLAGRVEQGVADSMLEASVLGDGTGTARDTVLDAAAGKNWTLVGPGEEHGLDLLPPDLRSRIRTEIAAGRLAFLLLEPASRGWWRIDPATGSVLAMRSTGGGAVLAEEAFVFVQGVGVAACLYAMGEALAGGGPWGGKSVAAAGAVCLVMGGGTGLALSAVGSVYGGLIGMAVAAVGLGLVGGAAAGGGL
jgi:hypothetical protein